MVRMVAELTPEYPSQYAAIGVVAKKLGIGTAETLRKCAGPRPVLVGGRARPRLKHTEIRRLRREVVELRQVRFSMRRRLSSASRILSALRRVIVSEKPTCD
jgi:transposase